MGKSIGVMLTLSDISRVYVSRERAANGDFRVAVQLWRLMIALKKYVG